jgi:hypothetical protein
MVWIRNWIFQTRFGQKRGNKLFFKLLSYDVPSLSQS